MRCVVVRYLYRQSGMELVDSLPWIATVLAIDSGWTSMFERVKCGGLVHLYVCIRGYKSFYGGETGDACFAVKCQKYK